MINGFVAKKVNMSQVFTDEGIVIPVTILSVDPCVVTQVKTQEKDGYDAIQVGTGHTKPKLLKKPQQGHLKNIKQNPKLLREFENVEDSGDVEVGAKIKVDEVFKVGDVIRATATSKGGGFAGVIKRHGFHGGPKTHGQSDRHRAPGSIGGGTTPGRVYKGKKMAGRMGTDTVTMRGLEVVEIDVQNNILKIKGAVPGYRGSVVILRKDK